MRDANTSDEGIGQAIAGALHIQMHATGIMAHHAHCGLGEKTPAVEPGNLGDTNRITELIAVGAIFGVNCTSAPENRLAAVQAVEIFEE